MSKPKKKASKPKEPELCPECKERPAVPGSCPYQSEINDTDFACDCCDECRHECAMDI